jgi:hypothetical protein
VDKGIWKYPHTKPARVDQYFTTIFRLQKLERVGDAEEKPRFAYFVSFRISGSEIELICRLIRL